jgi:hypothetical protein
MSLIVRIDVDRPYGRQPLLRHIASRVSSDYGLPTMVWLGYLRELLTMLRMLHARRVPALVFFRRCTLPTEQVLGAIDAGGHQVGLHLEDSRSYETFLAEKRHLEKHARRPVRVLSKHGSGGEKYGRHHHSPYEPERYVQWAQRSGMDLVLGNQEDPKIPAIQMESGVSYFPAAFWLEPHWRDCNAYPIDWLIARSRAHDVVLLIHPENVLADRQLLADFLRAVESCPVKFGRE